MNHIISSNNLHLKIISQLLNSFIFQTLKHKLYVIVGFEIIGIALNFLQKC